MPPLPRHFIPGRILRLRVRSLAPPYIPALDTDEPGAEIMMLDGASEQADFRAARTGLQLADFEDSLGRLPGEGGCR